MCSTTLLCGVDGDCVGQGLPRSCVKAVGSLKHHADANGQLSDPGVVTDSPGDTAVILGFSKS
jgi:hypothetical protein